LNKEINGKEIDFYQFVTNSHNAIMLIGKDKRVLYFNKACLNLLKTQDLLNKPIDHILHEDFHASFYKRLEKVFYENINAEFMEQKMITSNGECIPVEVMASPYEMNGSVLAQVTIRDITIRKQAEKLYHNREKLATLGQLSAGIAHEIRNPLTAVKGFVQLLKEELDHYYLEVISSELERALTTVNNLLQVSRPDIEEERSVSIHLCNELEAVLFLFQEKLYNIKVIKDLRNVDITLVGKKNLLLKAFFNLIKNAIEAIEKNGIIRIEHFYEENYIHIIISDNGVGICGEELNLLGTPFYSTKSDGTGMGLTQVYTTVHEHGGFITVDSEQGKGTSFHLHLPLTK